MKGGSWDYFEIVFWHFSDYGEELRKTMQNVIEDN
jgi:hypothetical protein